MFEQDADEQLDGVADTQDVEEFQEIVQAPKPDWFSGTWKWDVVQQVVDEAFEHLQYRKQQHKFEK